MRRLGLTVLAIGALVLTLFSVHGVPSGGYVGVGVGPDGAIVGYVQMCRGRVDRVHLYSANGERGSAVGMTEWGVWRAPQPVTGFATWTISEPGAWPLTHPLRPLERFVDYVMYGRTEDNRWSARRVAFQLDDLTDLEPGQVIFSGGVVTESEFRSTACQAVPPHT